jgi:protein-L-isoaspartate(D-aspartate) O-methyltransferase
MIDTFKTKGVRKQMIEMLQTMGITNSNVLEAMNRVPRHFFLDNAFLEFAYQNKAFQIGAGQTISHPYTVAFQSQLLNIKKGEKVLEIGTGCGYQTAVLCELGAKVYSIERQKTLYIKTKELLKQMNYSAQLYYGDGYEGKEIYAPFHKIIVTAGAPFIPIALQQQLMLGGKLIIPVGEGDTQEMIELEKTSPSSMNKIMHGDFKFVPLLPQKN